MSGKRCHCCGRLLHPEYPASVIGYCDPCNRDECLDEHGRATHNWPPDPEDDDE